MNDFSHLTDTELNEALSSCRRAIDSEHEVEAVYAQRDAIIAEMELRRVSSESPAPCNACQTNSRKCDFDPERGSCSVLS